MTDPYTALGRELAAAAERQAGRRGARGRARTWLSRRPSAPALAAVLVLAGGAVAVAATGVLSGSAVKPEVALNPVAGNGLPVAGGAVLLGLRAADPEGGLPWDMRVLHTTRGQTCLQVGRVRGGQLGELGLDSAFGDDQRFHALPADVLPPGYGGSQSFVECTEPGHTLIYENANADRSAVRILPEEFQAGPKARNRKFPPRRDLRAISFGLLGSHAVSVTYRTPRGLRTVPVSEPGGAFLIVEAAGYIKNSSTVGGFMSGQATSSSVEVILIPPRKSAAMVSAVTFRFGRHLCSQGFGSPVRRHCPTYHTTAPRRWFTPTLSLHAPVHLALLAQSHADCSKAFLTDPCYKGEIEFTAPYAVPTAATDYLVKARAKCKLGGRPETAWELERNVRLHETVRTVSLGFFKFTPACVANESFQVSYLNPQGPSPHAPHESVIVGVAQMRDATRP